MTGSVLGSKFTDGLACPGVPESNAGLAGMVIGQTDREHLAVRAVSQTQYDLALRERPADFLAGGSIPEPDEAVVIARGQDLAVRLKCQGRDIVGVRHRRKPQAARARLPESHLARCDRARIAPGRKVSAVRAAAQDRGRSSQGCAEKVFPEYDLSRGPTRESVLVPKRPWHW